MSLKPALMLHFIHAEPKRRVGAAIFSVWPAALREHGFIYFLSGFVALYTALKCLIDSHSASTHLTCTIQNSLTVINWPLFSDVSFNLLN